jgi:hypothetical protein
MSLDAAYRLVEGPPSTCDYLALRLRAGLSPKREDQAAAALRGGWAACHVVHEDADRESAPDSVGMLLTLS